MGETKIITVNEWLPCLNQMIVQPIIWFFKWLSQLQCLKAAPPPQTLMAWQPSWGGEGNWAEWVVGWYAWVAGQCTCLHEWSCAYALHMNARPAAHMIWFWIGHGLVMGYGPGVGDPCLKGKRERLWKFLSIKGELSVDDCGYNLILLHYCSVTSWVILEEFFIIYLLSDLN